MPCKNDLNLDDHRCKVTQMTDLVLLVDCADVGFE